MNRRCRLLVLIFFISAAALVACGGGGGGGGGGDATVTTTPTPTTQGTVVSAPTASPITSFTQSLVSNDTGTYNEVFPGQANVWFLDQDFSLLDGFDEQFIYAIALSVGSGADYALFETDQIYSELTFTGPYLGPSDGVKVAAVSNGNTVLSSLPAGVATVIAGTYAAFLNATSDSRLQQTLDLTAVPAGSAINLSWQDAVTTDSGVIPGYDPSYRVVVRSEDGTELKQLYANPALGTSGLENDHSGLLLNQYAGQKIVLSFEERSMTSPWAQAYAIIDKVSVTVNGTEYITNGGFETGTMTGWTGNTPVEAQNVTSGVRTLKGLEVRRSFYTVPNKLWGRWVDVFENHTAAAISTPVSYETLLGSAGGGILYYAPGTSNKALTCWDSLTGARDVGLVFGNAAAVDFLSDDGTGIIGSELITVTYNVTVPPGGSVALVNFVIMDGTDTGLANPGITNVAAKAADIDTEAAAIVNNFWTDPQYQAGMTPEQIVAIKNFSH